MAYSNGTNGMLLYNSGLITKNKVVFHNGTWSITTTKKGKDMSYLDDYIKSGDKYTPAEKAKVRVTAPNNNVLMLHDTIRSRVTKKDQDPNFRVTGILTPIGEMSAGSKYGNTYIILKTDQDWRVAIETCMYIKYVADSTLGYGMIQGDFKFVKNSTYTYLVRDDE